MKKEIIVSIVLIALIGLAACTYIAAYAYSASKVELRDVNVTDLEDINLEGAKLTGYIELYNGGIVTVSIEQIDYRLVLEGQELVLAKGTIVGGEIPAKSSVNYTVQNEIMWAPTAELALELLTSEKTTAKLQGQVLLKKTWFVDIAIPFEKEIELNNYLNQFIKKQIEETVPKNIIEKGKQILENMGLI